VISSPQILYFLFQCKLMIIFTKFTMNIRPLEFNLWWMQEVAVRWNDIANIVKLYCNMQHRHEIFLFSRASRPSLWPIQPLSYPIDTRDCLWEILQPKHEGYHSSQSSSKVKNVGLYTSTSPHLHREKRSNFFLVRTWSGNKLCTVKDLYKNRYNFITVILLSVKQLDGCVNTINHLCFIPWPPGLGKRNFVR